MKELNDLLEKVDKSKQFGKKRSTDSGKSKPSAGGSSSNTTGLVQVHKEAFQKYSRNCGPDRKWPFVSIAKSDKS